jgi:myosin heavy subunit
MFLILEKLHIKSVNDFVFLKRGEDAVTEDINDARDFGTLKVTVPKRKRTKQNSFVC